MIAIENNADAAEAAFYRAFAARDAEAMRRIWTDASTTICMHPGGPLLRGTQEILQSWTQILTNAAATKIDYEVVHSLTSGALAIHTVRESIRSTGTQDQPTLVIATNVYQKGEFGWQMLLHHASLPLIQRDQQDRSLH